MEFEFEVGFGLECEFEFGLELEFGFEFGLEFELECESEFEFELKLKVSFRSRMRSELVSKNAPPAPRGTHSGDRPKHPGETTKKTCTGVSQ